MNNTDKSYELVFESLIAADKNIWEAILQVQESGDADLKKLAKPLMHLRGEMHTEFMRPIYKKYPDLAAKGGFNDE